MAASKVPHTSVSAVPGCSALEKDKPMITAYFRRSQMAENVTAIDVPRNNSTPADMVQKRNYSVDH